MNKPLLLTFDTWWLREQRTEFNIWFGSPYSDAGVIIVLSPSNWQVLYE